MLRCQEESECRLKQWDTTSHTPEWPKFRRENTKCWLGYRATGALVYWWGSAEWHRFIGEQIGLRWFVLSNSNGLRMNAYARTYMQILRAAQKSPVWLLVSEWLQEQMMRDGPVPIYIFESIKPWEGTRWHGTKQMKPMKKSHVLCGDIYMTSWKDKAGSNFKKKSMLTKWRVEQDFRVRKYPHVIVQMWIHSIKLFSTPWNMQLQERTPI